MTPKIPSIPSVSVTYARDGRSTRSNALGMRPMAERAYQKRGEQYLLIKAPPASGKSRALMFIALDKLQNQKLKQAIIIVPEKNRCDAKDRYGRTLGHVFGGDADVNLELVRRGLAWHYVKYAPKEKELADAERDARAAKRDL